MCIIVFSSVAFAFVSNYTNSVNGGVIISALDSGLRGFRFDLHPATRGKLFTHSLCHQAL